MAIPPSQPLPWQFNQTKSLVPVTYNGGVVGFCYAEYAEKIVGILNEEDKLRKALRVACLDVIKRTGGDPKQIEQVMKKYLAMGQRPKYGSFAIAYLLRDRQEELDVSDKEFARFCDSYRLSLPDLRNIYQGKPIDDILIDPIARILGKPASEVLEVRDGPPSANNI